MRRYRTEIVIPADRTIVLQLPDDLPEGAATLVVQMNDEYATYTATEHDDDDLCDLLDVDDQDIEWWEEFEDVTR